MFPPIKLRWPPRFLSRRQLPTPPPTPTPTLNGVAEPGEVVWAWVPYEYDPTQGKDRPVIAVSRSGDRWLSLPLTSKDHHRDAAQESSEGRFWMDVGSGGWDTRGRDSEVRLDRLVRIADADIRREGAVLDPALFARVVAAAAPYL